MASRSCHADQGQMTAISGNGLRLSSCDLKIAEPANRRSTETRGPAPQIVKGLESRFGDDSHRKSDPKGSHLANQTSDTPRSNGRRHRGISNSLEAQTRSMAASHTSHSPYQSTQYVVQEVHSDRQQPEERRVGRRCARMRRPPTEVRTQRGTKRERLVHHQRSSINSDRLINTKYLAMPVLHEPKRYSES